MKLTTALVLCIEAITILFQDESPNKVVRFPGMPEAVDVLIEVKRKRPNEPMTFRLSVKACYEEGSATSTYSSVPSVHTASSSVYSAITSGQSGSVTSSAYGQSSSASSTYGTPTTVCTVEEGMDNPKYIPDRNIRNPNGRTPEDADRLRPSSRRPYTVDRNREIIRFLLSPARPIESLELVNPENVRDFTVRYIRPGRPGNPVTVVEVLLITMSERV